MNNTNLKDLALEISGEGVQVITHDELNSILADAKQTIHRAYGLDILFKLNGEACYLQIKCYRRGNDLIHHCQLYTLSLSYFRNVVATGHFQWRNRSY